MPSVSSWRLTMKTTSMTLIGCAGLLVAVGLGFAETGMSSHVPQIKPYAAGFLKSAFSQRCAEARTVSNRSRGSWR